MQPILKKYLEKVINQNKKLDCRGVLQVNRIIELDLDEIFVSLNAQVKKSERMPYLMDMMYEQLPDSVREKYPSRAMATRKETGLSLDELWQRSNRWAILGDPGAGKTTILRHQALMAARAALNGKSSCLPVFVFCRLFAHAYRTHTSWMKEAAIIDYLRGPGLEELGFSENERDELVNIFISNFEEGNILLLLDGLDEQRDGEIKQKTGEAVNALLDRYPFNRCMLTSRIIGFDQSFLGSSFETATLEPFSKEAQMPEFYRKWFYAVERAEDIVDDETTKKKAYEKAQYLIEQIQRNDRMSSLAANPLMCTIIGLIYGQGGALPKEIARLYKLCIDTFIFNWEMHKRKKGIETESLDEDNTQAALEAIALYMHENCEENRASRAELLQVIRKHLVEEAGLSGEQAAAKGERLLDLIQDIAGLMVDKGHNEYGFFHLTFQEYLTARAITKKRAKIDYYLGKYLFNPNWREVIYLAAAHQGMKDEETGGEFIKAIIRHPHQHEDVMHYAFRIALKCLRIARIDLETSDNMLKDWIGMYLSMPYSDPFLLDSIEDSHFFMRYTPSSLQGLFYGLSASEDGIRLNVINALGRIKDPSAVNSLIELLNDGNEGVRDFAAWALGRIKDPSAVPDLIKLLNGGNEDVRNSAALALSEIKDPSAVSHLIELLNDGNEGVRDSSAWALGLISDPSVVPHLIELLKDGNEGVRDSSAWALGLISDPSAVRPLIELLKDENEDIRRFAAKALGEIKDPSAVPILIELLKDGNEDIRRSAAKALGLIKNPSAAPHLTELLKDGNEGVRGTAASALGQIKYPLAVPLLMELLKDGNEGVRDFSAWALGEINDPTAVPDLIKLLNDGNENVRSSAAWALGRIKDPSAVPNLIKLLNDGNENVRSSAAWALGEISDPSAVPELIKLLNDGNENVRLSSVSALGRIKDPSAVPDLIKLLKDGNKDVRDSSASALGQIKDPSAVPDLIELLNDGSESVRFSAAWALGLIKDQSAVMPMIERIKDSEETVRYALMEAVEMIELGAAI